MRFACASLGLIVLAIALAPFASSGRGQGPSAGDEPSAGGEPSSAGGDSPVSLDELMRTLASSSGVVADFVQKKELGLLSVPLESRGRLYFIPPECMVWSITTPAESTLVIQGKRVSFSDGIRDQAIDLSQNRIARGFVEGFMVLFNGDHRSMKAQYEVGFHSGEDGWKLELVPRSPRLRRFIESIALSGRSGPLERMVLLEADGDRTTTTFERIEVEHHFDAEEIHDLFGPSSSCGRS